MARGTSDRLNKIRSNYDALASAYAREISGELDHRPRTKVSRDIWARCAAS